MLIYGYLFEERKEFYPVAQKRWQGEEGVAKMWHSLPDTGPLSLEDREQLALAFNPSSQWCTLYMSPPLSCDTSKTNFYFHFCDFAAGFSCEILFFNSFTVGRKSVILLFQNLVQCTSFNPI